VYGELNKSKTNIMKLYSATELTRKYNGKYIYVYPVYDYDKHEQKYEVRGVSKTIKENYNLPQNAIII
jgi:hypothetical protein